MYAFLGRIEIYKMHFLGIFVNKNFALMPEDKAVVR